MITATKDQAVEYAVEVDRISEADWYDALGTFDDANLYHTWAHATVLAGEANASRLVVRRHGEIVAMVQARIAALPVLNAGIAYVRWGPLWRKRGVPAQPEVLRRALRAMHDEYVVRRKLVLRVLPYLFNDDDPVFSEIFAQEGFAARKQENTSRTLLMDITRTVDQLRENLGRNWKRNLKAAERHDLSIESGTSVAMFEEFIRIYDEMVDRKGFAEPNDIRQFRAIQAALPEHYKMKITLCRSGTALCAGLIWSEIGGTAIELFAATSDLGLQAKGSYILRWDLVGRLKAAGFKTYNLNGINPEANPGGYKFKSDLAGGAARDVRFVGQFDARGKSISGACIVYADRLRKGYGRVRQFGKSFARSMSPAKPAH